MTAESAPPGIPRGPQASSKGFPGAVEDVKQASHYITKRAGGHGAVREVIDMILKAKGLWDHVLQRYL